MMAWEEASMARFPSKLQRFDWRPVLVVVVAHYLHGSVEWEAVRRLV